MSLSHTHTTHGVYHIRWIYLLTSCLSVSLIYTLWEAQADNKGKNSTLWSTSDLYRPHSTSSASQKTTAVRKLSYCISPSLFLDASTVWIYSIRALVEELKEKGDMPWILLMIWLYSTGLNVSRCHRHSKVLRATPRVCSSKCLPPHIPEPHWMWQVLDKYVKRAECQSCRSWLWVALKDGSSQPLPAIRRIGL